MTDIADLPPPLSFDRTTDPLDPPPQLTRWQREERVRRVVAGGVPAWLVIRHADVRALLSASGLSSDPTRAGFPKMRPDQPPPARGYIPSMDPPGHTKLREVIMRGALVNNVEQLRPVIERHANELVDAITLLPPPADLVEQFAVPLPVRVICELFGVPYQDRAVFEHCAGVLASRSASGQAVATAYRTLKEYIGKLIDIKDRDPANDLFTELVQHIRSGRITREDAVGVSFPLLTGGHMTTTNQIALSVVALLRYPEQAEIVLQRPDLLPRAVDELVRYLTVVHFGLRRVAVEDIEIADTTIRAGEGVILALQSANRDPDVFADPDRLDLTRRARRHVAFGYGVHRCPGQALAKVELEIALAVLFRGLPHLALAAPLEEITFDEGSFLHGVRGLPVVWQQSGASAPYDKPEAHERIA